MGPLAKKGSAGCISRKIPHLSKHPRRALLSFPREVYGVVWVYDLPGALEESPPLRSMHVGPLRQELLYPWPANREPKHGSAYCQRHANCVLRDLALKNRRMGCDANAALP